MSRIEEEMMLKRLELGSVVEEYLELRGQCGCDDDEVKDDIADCIFDATNERIHF
jgi:hypothetical protein